MGVKQGQAQSIYESSKKKTESRRCSVSAAFQLITSTEMEFTATSLTITCAILCAVVSILFTYMGRRRLYKSVSKFDGPPTLPLIGNAHLFIGSTEDHLKRINEIVSFYPAPFRLWIAHKLFIVVTDPEQIKAILMSPKTLEKGFMYQFLKPFVGSALVAAPGPEWRVHRKLIQPTFNAKILNTYVQVFYTQSKILANEMERNLDGPEFKIYALLVLASLDMLCETLMDTEIGAQRNSKLPYEVALQKVVKIAGKRLFSVWLYPDFIFDRTQLGKDQRRAIEILHDFTDKVIRRREEQLLKRDSILNSDPNNEEDDDFVRPKREVFIDHLMKISHEGNKFSNENLHDEVTEMMIAGHDTTAATLSFTLLMLASHSDVQDKVHQELSEIYGDDDDREVTHDDLARMNYLERVIKETMRLFPAFPVIVRAVSDDLDIGEHTLPKGSEAAIPVFEVHRNEKYWPDPMKFDPDRFLPEEIAKRHPYSYLAFSGGPRNCIGLRHAMMGMKTLLATILRKYNFKKDIIVPVKDIRLKIEVGLKPVHPITVKIERRTHI